MEQRCWPRRAAVKNPVRAPYRDRVSQPVPRIDCVGGIVEDDSGRLLLVRRGQEPAKGRWSVPGGRVEPGETDEEATAREVLEETGVRVSVERLVGVVEREAPAGVYVIRDYACRPLGGDVRAGDDADDAGWFTAAELRALDTSPGLVEALESWGVLTG
jgi:ADP-ribose pyrophosphatase YjhB (NUDIX family)